MKDESTPPCWREAWAEEQESGDSVAAWLVILFAALVVLGSLLY